MSADTLRDPAARARLGAAALALIVLWPALVLSEFKPWVLFDASQLTVMRGYLAGFLPPAHSAEFLGQLLQATLQTLAIATAGMLLAWLLAVPLALLATDRLSVSGLVHPRGLWPGRVARRGARTALMALRAVPEVVWALVFVRALSLGPPCAVLALGLTYGGMLGKVYAEILDAADVRPVRALLLAGSSRSSALWYALLPLAGPELVSYTVYRWECAVRASVIMGFVGAGGLGQLMDQSTKMLAGGETSAILMTFLLLVLLADAISAALRRVLA
jgi:phosphonate transport system permease protein